MSSGTSTDHRGRAAAAVRDASAVDPGLQPWQFFLLAGMLSATGVVLVAVGQSPASIIVLSLTVVSASFVALAAYRALAPLVVDGAAEAPPLIVGRTRAGLEREKTLVLRAIKDLEFDFAMKKVAKGDFDEMSARLRARAIGLMRQLDESGVYKLEIEEELNRRLNRRVELGATSPAGKSAARSVAGAARSASGEPLPAVDAVTGAPGLADLSASSSGSSDAAATAPAHDEMPSTTCRCGTANDPDARFCKSCGSPLVAA